ncbi:MAG: nucleotidyl transferase AbiEii/AbiGii toxin family protein [Acidobacteria bacterium]|nr:nucleotidyl transferase AbiEii/AbiGii toxin family protein [Acidobacteriota bacterium]
MTVEDAVRLALDRARQLRVDPQLTVSEVYEAQLLGFLQQKIRGAVVWKGGTVLRLEGSERFSRDLDATRRSASLTTQRLIKVLREVQEDLPHSTGVEINFQPQSIVAVYRFSVPGLRQPLRVIAEISLREKILRPPTPISTARIAHPLGLGAVVVARLGSEELLAEKVCALVMRLAGRDIYDVYWLLLRGIEFDSRLFLSKMRYYEKIGKPVDPIATMEKAIKQLDAYNPSRAKMELANLFPAAQRKLDFDVIVKDVAQALKSWLPLLSSVTRKKGKRSSTR